MAAAPRKDWRRRFGLAGWLALVAAGIFVFGLLVADAANPVIRELRARSIEPTALHSHMWRESPRLFFLHFRGVGEPEKIGQALRAALAKTAVAS